MCGAEGRASGGFILHYTTVGRVTTAQSGGCILHYSMEGSVVPEWRVYIVLLSGGFIQHKYLLQHSAVEGLNSTTEKGFFAPGWMVHITLQLRGIILDYKVKGLFCSTVWRVTLHCSAGFILH